jgi:hypothetical protein
VDAVYGLVFNLGSLACRILFEPIETQSRMQFGRLAAAAADFHDAKEKTFALRVEVSGGGGGDGAQQEATAATEAWLGEARQLYRARWAEMVGALRVRLMVVGAIGAVFAAFGPAYAYLLLHLLFGAEWSATAAPLCLGLYCLYVLLMAINGMLEAFRDSVASAAQLGEWQHPLSLNGFSLLCFGASAAAAVQLVPRYGGEPARAPPPPPAPLNHSRYERACAPPPLDDRMPPHRAPCLCCGAVIACSRGHHPRQLPQPRAARRLLRLLPARAGRPSAVDAAGAADRWRVGLCVLFGGRFD